MNYKKANKIAKEVFQAELDKLNLNSINLNLLTISGFEEKDSFIFELYIPSEKPIDARVLAKVVVFKKNCTTKFIKIEQ